MTQQQKNNATVGLGVGLAAGVAAAAGAYWLYGAKHSARHRKMAKSWMLKARAEVMDAIEKIEDIDKTKYLALVDDVLKRYGDLGISSQEVAHVASDFKKSWAHVQGKGKKVLKKLVKKGKKASKPKRKVSKR